MPGEVTTRSFPLNECIKARATAKRYRPNRQTRCSDFSLQYARVVPLDATCRGRGLGKHRMPRYRLAPLIVWDQQRPGSPAHMMGAALSTKGSSLNKWRAGRRLLPQFCGWESSPCGSHATTGTPGAARKTKQNKTKTGARTPNAPTAGVWVLGSAMRAPPKAGSQDPIWPKSRGWAL